MIFDLDKSKKTTVETITRTTLSLTPYEVGKIITEYLIKEKILQINYAAVDFEFERDGIVVNIAEKTFYTVGQAQ